MSGWIKIEKDLESDPRVHRIVRRLIGDSVTHERIKYANTVTQVFGALARLWIFADSHLRDDDTLDMTDVELDEWLGIPCFCAAMPEDWLRVLDGGQVELPGFQEHNGTEAKGRALTQKRVERHRKRSHIKERNAAPLPDQTRPDQTRPKKKTVFTPHIDLDIPSWERWQEYRKSIGKPIKPASLQAAADELAKHGADQAAVVQQSVAQGWQGIFALKTANGVGGQRKTTWVPPEDFDEEVPRATQ